MPVSPAPIRHCCWLNWNKTYKPSQAAATETPHAKYSPRRTPIPESDTAQSSCPFLNKYKPDSSAAIITIVATTPYHLGARNLSENPSISGRKQQAGRNTYQLRKNHATLFTLSFLLHLTTRPISIPPFPHLLKMHRPSGVMPSADIWISRQDELL